MCPVCAARISEFRRGELAAAISAARGLGLSVYLQTLTFRHSRRDLLWSTLEHFNSARRRMTEGKYGTVLLRERFGYVGKVTALEVTYGEGSGWHPHAHELVFLPSEVNAEQYSRWARIRWSRSAQSQGLSLNEHGFDFRATSGAVEDYVAKYGHQPLHAPWGPDAELVKSHLKRPKDTQRLSPFGLLALSSESGPAASLFQEFGRTFKGKHQLQWSQGLRELLGIEDKTDAEVVEQREEEMYLLGFITPAQWRVVLASDARAEVVIAARTGQWSAVEEVLQAIGA